MKIELEFIKLRDLLKAINEPYKASKEDNNISMSQVLQYVDDSNFTKEQKIELEKDKTFTIYPIEVQKVNDSMKVIDGVYKIKMIVDILEKYNVDIKDCDLTLLCCVEYVKSFRNRV